jgi:predicted lysophospholipase L1 biosynthesis ABC-type transport system permease subunit
VRLTAAEQCGQALGVVSAAAACVLSLKPLKPYTPGTAAVAARPAAAATATAGLVADAQATKQLQQADATQPSSEVGKAACSFAKPHTLYIQARIACMHASCHRQDPAGICMYPALKHA